jgi:hypothetical protein
MAAGMAPGASLCRAWSRDAHRDGLEIVLKDGQIEDEKFLGTVRAGGTDVLSEGAEAWPGQWRWHLVAPPCPGAENDLSYVPSTEY